jgi:hypothetical protein
MAPNDGERRAGRVRRFLRGPGESYGHVILRVVELEAADRLAPSAPDAQNHVLTI